MALNPLSIFAGPSPLPPQTSTVTDVYAPKEFTQGQQSYAGGQALVAGGQSLLAGGQSALEMAERGELTAPQQAALEVYNKGLKNTALQTYAGMGITPSKSTSWLSSQEDIDQKTLAMSQSFIQSTIQAAMAEFAAGGTELSTGTSMMGQSAQFEDAASKDLLATAQMQVQQDQAYSKLIGDTLQAVAKMAAVAAAPVTGGASLLALPALSGGGGGSGYEGDINTPANPSSYQGA
jgi:hypothetical protein